MSLVKIRSVISRLMGAKFGHFNYFGHWHSQLPDCDAHYILSGEKINAISKIFISRSTLLLSATVAVVYGNHEKLHAITKFAALRLVSFMIIISSRQQR